MNGEGDRFLADLRGTYRTLWTNGIPVDVVTPSHDWASYDLVILSNVALMTGEARERIARTLADSSTVRLIAAGNLGMYSDNGCRATTRRRDWVRRSGSGCRTIRALRMSDISQGPAIVDTLYGSLPLESPTGYAILEPRLVPMPSPPSIARLSPCGRRTGDAPGTGSAWLLASGDVGSADILLGVLSECGIEAPVALRGDRVVPVVRKSARGGRLLFLFNVESRDASVSFTPRWGASTARDLLAGEDIPRDGEYFHIDVPQWGVGVVHCP